MKASFKYSKKLFSLTLITTLMAGCASYTRTPVDPLHGTPVQISKTNYSALLNCLGEQVKGSHRYVLAVDKIPDLTGKFSAYNGGFEVTQGAEDMVISAIGETHAFKLVERLDLSIPINEIQYANQFLLSDNVSADNIVDKQGRMARALHSGAMMGSDYYISGAITEVNYNVDSGGFTLSLAGYTGGWREFWMDVALDLRLVDTKTTQVVAVFPVRKQVFGYENEAGALNFYGTTLLNFNAGKLRQEPVGLAVRAAVESAVGDLTKYLYHLPNNACAAQVPVNS